MLIRTAQIRYLKKKIITPNPISAVEETSVIERVIQQYWQDDADPMVGEWRDIEEVEE